MDLITKAIQFATEKHAGQFRKKTTIPFILHCMEAGLIASEMTMKDGKVDDELVAAQMLHDTIEDAGVTYGELKENFGDRVANLVNYQSEDKSKSWMERKTHTIEFLKSNDKKEIEIAFISDKLANVRSLKKELEKGDELWGKFNAPKKLQKWYYTSIGLQMKQIKETPQFAEYMELLNQIFFESKGIPTLKELSEQVFQK